MNSPETPAAQRGLPIVLERSSGARRGESAMNQPHLFDGGKLIGATLLCLVLGTWISLVHKNMSRPSASAELAAHATPSARAPLPTP